MAMKKLFVAVVATAWISAAAMAQAASLPNFVDLAKGAGPAVVNIGTERTAKSAPEDMFGGMLRNV
ncbi:MAG: peptidase, partial [Desulfovibrionaceae bacterium]|nr:peptidase [Desulfovibrionaceae bacterium]